MPYAPTLTAAELPSPRVRVDFNSVPARTFKADVYRFYDDASGSLIDSDLTQYEQVPGGQGIFAGGGFTFTDLSVPIGRRVHYNATFFDANDAYLGASDDASTVIWGDEGFAWYSNPYDPDLAVLVPLRSDFGGGKRTLQQQAFLVSGQTVGLTGARGMITDFNASCITDSLEQRALLRKVVDSGLVLVRGTARQPYPANLYLVVPEVSEAGIGSLDDLEFGGERSDWVMTGCYQVRAPVLSGQPKTATYEAYYLAYGSLTYAQVAAIYRGTYLDAEKNPPK